MELTLIYEKLQQLEEVPANGKCANTMPAFKKEGGNYKLVGITSASPKMVEYLVLESISNHVDNAKMNTGTVSTDLVRAIHA